MDPYRQPSPPQAPPPKRLDPAKSLTAAAYLIMEGAVMWYLFHTGKDAATVATGLTTVGGALMALYNPWRQDPPAPPPPAVLVATE